MTELLQKWGQHNITTKVSARICCLVCGIQKKKQKQKQKQTQRRSAGGAHMRGGGSLDVRDTSAEEDAEAQHWCAQA